MNTDTLSIVGPPDVVTLVTETGATGPRGSLWFTGAGMPSSLTIPDYDSLKVGDMYVDQNDGGIYQMILLPSNALDWIKVGVSAAAAAAATITSGEVVGDDLILTRTDERTVNAGSVRGPRGEVTSLGIGTVATTEPGGEASAEITGEAPNQTLNLVLPRGLTGDPGPAIELAVGTVTTLPPGGPATAQIIHDSGLRWLVDLGIPVGQPDAWTTVGVGRPDLPATTPYTAAQLNALPIGHIYRSTNGPQGAWVWRKTGASTWVVTDGDTGPISVFKIEELRTALLGGGGSVWQSVLRRINSQTYYYMYSNVGSVIQYTFESFFPAGFRPPNRVWKTSNANSTGTVGLTHTQISTSQTGDLIFHRLITQRVSEMESVWFTYEPWPLTLDFS